MWGGGGGFGFSFWHAQSREGGASFPLFYNSILPDYLIIGSCALLLLLLLLLLLFLLFIIIITNYY